MPDEQPDEQRCVPQDVPVTTVAVPLAAAGDITQGGAAADRAAGDAATGTPPVGTPAGTASLDVVVGTPPVGTPTDTPSVDAAEDVAVPDEDVAVPDEEALTRIATPGLVRRAPRFGAFIGYGAVLGFVVGVVLAIALDRGDLVAAGEGGGVLPFLAGSNGARLMSGVGMAGIGAILGTLLALWADARSHRRAR